MSFTLYSLPKPIRPFAYDLKNKIWKNKFRYMIQTGEAPLPNKIIFELTMRCNLTCEFCFRDKLSLKELTFKEVITVLENLGPSIKKIGFTGGEVFLRKDIFEILDYLANKKIKVGLLSNATLLNEQKIEKLVSYPNLNIGISLDGLEKTHNNIRGKNAFEKTFNNIKLINKRIKIGVNTVITKNNIDEILPLLQKTAPYIHSYCIEFEMFNTPEEIIGSAKFLNVNKDKVMTWATKKEGYEYPREKIIGIIKKIKIFAKKNNILFVPSPTIVEYYFDMFYQGRVLAKQPLCGHLMTARCDNKGNLVFCHLIKEELGSLLDNKLEKLWNSKKIKAIRKNLLAKYMPPLCKRCCRLA